MRIQGIFIWIEGEVEWPGIVGHINDTISHTLNIVRAGKTFLGMVEKRWMWPSARYRQCTSDLKRGPIEKFIRADIGVMLRWSAA